MIWYKEPMNAIWNLKTEEEIIEVSYTKSKNMDCGKTDSPFGNLVEWMLSNGSGKNEAIVVNGKFYGSLLPLVSETGKDLYGAPLHPNLNVVAGLVVNQPTAQG